MTTVSLLFPELLLLLVPLLFLYAWWVRASGAVGLVRLAALAILTLLAAVPIASIGGRGVDVVAVVDVSRSMPAESRARTLEIVGLIEEGRRTGDRVGVVLFGREARIEQLLEEQSRLSEFVQQVDDEGSDLGAAIALGASLIPPERPGRLIVLSDGEATGESTLTAAHDASARGIRVDVRSFGSPAGNDVAVESLDVPGVVDRREPFQFTATVRAERTTDAEVVLFRDSQEIARGVRTLPPGRSQFAFRDLVDRAGLARYRVQVTTAGDRIPENNIGDGAVRIEAPASLLVVNGAGTPGNLSRAVSAGGIPVTTVAPSAFPRTVADLQSYRAVILENVPARALGPQTLETLSRFTTDLGGGLLVTGGPASFGVGGYFKSELDTILPVSMEIKNEHRKLSLAMVMALDRSGSMAMPAGDGRTKMDLANLGTCAALETLGPFDEIGVIAVDSAAHIVQPLGSAENKDAVCQQVRQIQSMGGGIFTYTALVTAARMVQESEKGTRHIVLFADAADAEEPGDYINLLERLRTINVTVSVIGLGTEADADAEFLKDVAMRGGGRMIFTSNVEELPRLFAQEAITVARSSFVSEPTAVATLPDIVLLGERPSGAFPVVDGYNLTYLRPGATLGAVTADEYDAPLLAFWHRGLGRVAALTAEVDGKYSGRLNAWPGFAGFSVGVARWLLGGDPPTGVLATLERQGAEGVVRVELDPDRPRDRATEARAPVAVIVPPDGARTASQRLPLAWVGEHTLEARFPVHNTGVYVGAVESAPGQILQLPPLSLPYSPEFEPRVDPNDGRATLEEIARVSGGRERTTWDDVFSASGLRNRQVRDLVIPLALLLLCLHLTEIAGRRLMLFAAAPAWLRSNVPPLAAPVVAAWARVAPVQRRRRHAATAPDTVLDSDREPSPSVAADLQVRGSLSRGPNPGDGPSGPRDANVPRQDVKPDAAAVSSAMARAKAKARSRLEP
jgi:Mg-chelatase subunit ChlD